MVKLNTEDMAKAGLHFGHRASAVNPKMSPYLYGVRNGVHIIDLEKTKEKLSEALKFIKEIISEDKVLLLVGTKVQIKDLVKEAAKECALPYITKRWLGGTFTNFEVMKKRIDYFKDLDKKKAHGELEKYTKKEMAKLDLQMRNLETKFGGIKNIDKLPDALLILDIKKDNLVLKEARMKGIKVIGICDTNTDPTLCDYPVPANDDAISSVKYILDKVRETIVSAKVKTQSAKTEPRVLEARGEMKTEFSASIQLKTQS